MIDDQDKFNVQRRNLTLISSIVLFYEIGDVQLGNTAKLPFIDVTVQNTNAIEIFLHAILIYFFWRYITSFNDYVGAVGAFERYKKSLIKSIPIAAKKLAAKELSKNKIVFEDLGYGSTYQDGKAWHPLDQRSGDITKKGAKYRFSYMKIEGTKRILGGDNSIEIKLEGFDLLALKLKTFIKHIIFSNLFLEFYFPFLIATLALAETLQINIATKTAHFFLW